MYVYVYLFWNCVKTSGILLECALQVYWTFGWIYSHLVKSRIKKSCSRQLRGMFLFFRSTVHPDYDIQPLPVGYTCLFGESQLFWHIVTYLILRLMNEYSCLLIY